MITWMQRHKKWLIITIWISAIAFIGAGFVGWGSYNYGSKTGVIATVGKKEIKFEELNQEYSNLYNQYAQLFGASFNQELAKQLRLEDIALSQLLQKKLIMAYGDELGLISTEEDVVKELIQYAEFQVDGKFNKDKYIEVLNQNRIATKEFEKSISDAVLFQRVQDLFTINLSQDSLDNIGRILFMEDDIEMKVLSLKDIDVKIDEIKAKEYFEANKSRYNSQRAFEIEIKKLDIKTVKNSDEELKKYFDRFKSDYKFEDGKLKTFEEAKAEVNIDLNESNSKKEALNLYLKLKKDEEKFDINKIYTQNKLPFSGENISRVMELKEGEIGKPIIENSSFYIVKMVSKIEPKPLSFEEAKNEVFANATLEEKHKLLDIKAQEELANFKGTVYKNIDRQSTSRFKDLNKDEAQEFLNTLFVTTSKESSVKFEDKIVLFRIISSTLDNYTIEKGELAKQDLDNLLQNEVLMNLLKKLEMKYEIKTYIQNKE